MNAYRLCGFVDFVDFILDVVDLVNFVEFFDLEGGELVVEQAYYPSKMGPPLKGVARLTFMSAKLTTLSFVDF